MAINFPNNPVNGNTYTFLDTTYVYKQSGSDEGYWSVALPLKSGVASTAEIDAGVNAVKYLSPLAMESSKYGKPLELSSPNGTRYKIVVDDTGNLSTTLA